LAIEMLHLFSCDVHGTKAANTAVLNELTLTPQPH